MDLLRRSKKKGTEGFKELVRSLETSPPSKRIERFERLALEDPVYMDWVAKNLLSVKNLLDLDSSEFELILKELKNPAILLFRAFDNTPFEKFVLNSIPKGILGDYRDEKERMLEMKKIMKDGDHLGAQFALLEIVRKLQDQDKIAGILWHLPESDVMNFKNIPSKGTFELFYGNEVLALKGELEKSKRVGNWQHFFPTGELYAEGSYKDDAKTGHWTFYFPHNLKRCEGDFSGEFKVADWIFYDRNGKQKVVSMDKKE